MTTRAFQLPPLQDNPDGSWGPSPAHLPAKFKEIPYAPYSKSDKLGRFADWAEGDSSAQRGQGGPSATGTSRGGARAGGRKDGQQVYGSGAINAFSYFHVEDEASFSLVDNKTGGPRRGAGNFGFQRGRGAARGIASGRGVAGRGAAIGYGRGGQYGGRGGSGRGGGRRGWKDWEKTSRVREGSIMIDPNWRMLEEIDFLRLSKLRLEVEPPETLESYGRLYPYDAAYDRVTTKSARPLQIPEKTRFNPSTSDDPVIQKFITDEVATVYATDSILSMLMCAPRSVFGWDIIVVRHGDSVILDKRDGGSSDTITVNENAADPPADSEKETINSATSLALEAMFINTNFAIQVVKDDGPADLPNPNPFVLEDTEQLASAGYFYKLFDISAHEEEEVKLVLRTEVDAFMPGSQPNKGEGLIAIKALNEFDSKAAGAGGAPDWRTKLDSQRGAVMATEMKNNSFKMARWAVQSILAGADHMKLGYVSRSNTRDNSHHVILSTATMRPVDFATQLNVSLMNGWGIVRTVVDLCLKHPEGKYVLIKDPNKAVIRLYAVPLDAFTKEEDGDEDIPYEEDAE
ncbi:putative eIF3d-eukaryotic translation initiation factor 3 subunit D [Serendipita vermifera]|nr:putative eIF3d-eukaryotic translation initiation factor 3 subunit D [Serendipita vermifera]